MNTHTHRHNTHRTDNAGERQQDDEDKLKAQHCDGGRGLLESVIWFGEGVTLIRVRMNTTRKVNAPHNQSFNDVYLCVCLSVRCACMNGKICVGVERVVTSQLCECSPSGTQHYFRYTGTARWDAH